MYLAIYSFMGLMTLVSISHITSFIFHIMDDQFYNFFHLSAGILAVFFFYSISNNYIISIILTELLGIAWEIYEWCLWKLVLKKKKYQPQVEDTRNDLFLDFGGALMGILILSFLIGK